MTVAATAVASPRGVAWRDVVELLKLRIDALVVLVALAAAVAAGTSDPGTLLVLGGACLAASAGASALNHYFDRGVDTRMARTRARPGASRAARPRRVLQSGRTPTLDGRSRRHTHA